MKALNVHFADSFGFTRKLIKEKCQALRNQASVYKVIFKPDFLGHDALEVVKALSKILFDSPLGANACHIVNKCKTTTMESALEELIYLDHSYALQQSFQGNLCNSSDTNVIIKGLMKKLADCGIGYQYLRQLFEKQGEQGLLAILANPATASGRSSAQSINQSIIFIHDKYLKRSLACGGRV